ncbi:MAG: hypothetical protein BIFFINMI_02979 [Phycisphaerae bacterium]|nr:hypothetical protein [Phycisphaerae bacterium]
MKPGRSFNAQALLTAATALAFLLAPAAALAAPAAEDAESHMTLFQLLQAGGPVMYPLYLCSVVLLAFVLERLIRLRRGLIIPRSFAAAVRQMLDSGQPQRGRLLEYCKAHPSPAARIFQAAVTHMHRPLGELEKTIEDAGAREATRMARPCRAFSIIADISPLIGLLGTVWGMIQAFQLVAKEKAIGRPDLLAEGIYQALVTTAMGLTIAIPALVLYFVFIDRVERLVGEMDELTIRFVDALAVEPVVESA